MSLEGFYNTICPGSKKKYHINFCLCRRWTNDNFLLRAGGGKGEKGGRGLGVGCVTITFYLILASGSLIILSPPPPSLSPPPLLAVNRQSVFYSSLFILCRRPLIPPPFPLKTMRPPGEKVFYPNLPQPPRR